MQKGSLQDKEVVWVALTTQATKFSLRLSSVLLVFILSAAG